MVTHDKHGGDMSQTTIVKPSHTAYRLADAAALEELQHESGNESLKKSWIKVADQLEMDGIPKHKISTVGKQIIIEKKKEQLKKLNVSQQKLDDVSISGWWYDVMNEIDCIDPHYSHNTATDAERNNSSINTKNNEMLSLCDKIIDVVRTIKEKSQDCDELENIFGKKDTTEFYFQQNTMIDNIKNAIDNKTKIPENTELFLLECLATVMGNTNKCGEIFQQIIIMHMKEQGKFLTQKQATKFQSGGKQSKLVILRPTDRDFARYEKYTGIRCNKCQSFRIRAKEDHSTNWECFDCDNVMPRQHIAKCSSCQIPLYKERLQHIVKTGECANCHESVELPQTLIDQANS